MQLVLALAWQFFVFAAILILLAVVCFAFFVWIVER